VSVQWATCDSSDAGCTAIPGATSPTYTVPASEFGDYFAVEVTATN
jgi:hypothetical protein